MHIRIGGIKCYESQRVHSITLSVLPPGSVIGVLCLLRYLSQEMYVKPIQYLRVSHMLSPKHSSWYIQCTVVELERWIIPNEEMHPFTNQNIIMLRIKLYASMHHATDGPRLDRLSLLFPFFLPPFLRLYAVDALDGRGVVRALALRSESVSRLRALRALLGTALAQRPRALLGRLGRLPLARLFFAFAFGITPGVGCTLAFGAPLLRGHAVDIRGHDLLQGSVAREELFPDGDVSTAMHSIVSRARGIGRTCSWAGK